MTGGTLARRSLAFYWRSHLGTIAGAAIATAVLAGALLVGDSVRGTLRAMALARLGQVDQALASGDRLFRADLAAEIAQAASGAPVAAVLQLPGTAANPDGSARANQVQVNGVGAEFWKLASQNVSGELAEGRVWINEPLARQLRVNVGDTLLLRAPRISHLSRDAPLAPEEDASVALRLEVGRVLQDGEFGRFGLAASQVPPFNAFVPLAYLEQKVKATNQANLLLARGAGDLEAALRRAFSLADAQVGLQPVPGGGALEVRSSRVFLDGPTAQAALQVAGAQPVFTYFVNRLQAGAKTTPYSMVAAAAGITPADLRDDEIIINQWLADDLQAKPGDQIALSYYVMGLMRDLVERTNSFRVRAVAPMQPPYADKTLMPDFPGMTDAANCRDWDTGFPINTSAIRDKDEDYWHQYRGTPKAFITLPAAQRMWSNRFGNLTAARYPTAGGNVGEDEIRQALLAHLPPSSLGMAFQPVRAQALAASAGSQDFGGLFIGFSFFLVAAALLLMSLLFRFALEQRGVEVGILLALGFAPAKVRRLLLLEGAGLAAIGGALGVAGATLYAKAMLWGLRTVWSDAVAGSALGYYGSASTLGIGWVTGVLVAIATIWWGLRREGRRPARELLADGLDEEFLSETTGRPPRTSFVIGGISLLAALGLTGYGLASPDKADGDLFFSAGALLLIAGLCFTTVLLRRLASSSAANSLSITGIGFRSVTRRRKRSRAAVGLLASGAFLITSIGAFRLDAGKNAEARGSGTGGFALLAESSLPVVHNLNAKSGRDFYNLGERDLAQARFVPFRVLAGEDASCLNLNRAQRPRLLGVEPSQLGERKAFTFAETLKGAPAENPWLLLDQDFGPDVVPAVGDAASIQWALGKKLGDSIEYADATGKRFQVRLVGAVANSILQGSLVISEKQFVKRFPAEAGYRMFLIDAPSKDADALKAALSRALQDVGLEVSRTRDRLNTLNAVQNTYLGTFQMLGGLGLLLGTVGLGIILLRNVFERRSELALLLAVGFRKPALRWLILSEHAGLLLLGLLLGVLAAVLAVLPSLLAPGREVPLVQLCLTLGAVLFCGLIWTLIAAARALRAPLLQALRNE